MATTKKPKAGRKLFDGKNYDIVIQKLEEVWAMGGTDEEAAFNADISKTALSTFLGKNEPISERKNALLLNPILKARKTVYDELGDNSSLAFKFLERKRPSEFGPKTIEDAEYFGTIKFNNLKNDYKQITG